MKYGGRGGVKIYCSERCRVRVYRRNNPAYVAKSAARARERNAAKSAEREASLPPKSRCSNCDGELAVRSARARYCNAPACQSARKAAAREAGPRCSSMGCDSDVIAKGLCGSHYSREWRAANVDRSRDNRRARKARVRDAYVEPVLASEVMHRDRWVCGLCGGDIPPGAEWPDRLSASVDHIIPLSRGGEHSIANVQASHLGCNSRKGDRVEAAAVAV